jgi:hypothetical protein
MSSLGNVFESAWLSLDPLAITCLAAIHWWVIGPGFNLTNVSKAGDICHY